MAQPDVGRVGGLTEAVRVCHTGAGPGAADRAALLEDGHRHRRLGAPGGGDCRTARSSNTCRAELCDSPLRRELAVDGLTLRDGRLCLPDKPGLGVEINPEALEKFAWRGP